MVLSGAVWLGLYQIEAKPPVGPILSIARTKYRTESRKARARVAHAFWISTPTTFKAVQLYIYSKIIQFFIVALREA